MRATQRVYTLAMAIIAWLGLVLQFYVMPKDNGIGKAAENFFSYFTVLSNILVAVYATARLAGYGNRDVASRTAQAGAIVLYITVVAIVYHTLLSGLWKPTGWPFVANQLLHSITPILFIINWWVYERKGLLRARHAVWFLVFPLAYIIYSIVHGELSGFYPYPFIDVSQLGYPRAVMHTALLLAAFFLLGRLVIWLDGYKRKPQVT